MAKSECCKCGKFFTAVSSFDKHRVGKYEPNTRRCLSTEEMLERKMILNQRGVWASEAFSGPAYWKDRTDSVQDLDEPA